MFAQRISTGPCLFVLVLAGTMVGTLIFTHDAHAQTERGDGYDLDLEFGVEHRDNPLRLSPRGPSDTLLVPRATFNLFRLGTQWRARGAGFIEYRHSVENVIDNEFHANLAAVVDREITPGLNWTFQNVARVEYIDVLAAETPDNRQQTNVFITGPRWEIRPGRAWGAVLNARFINSWAEETDEFDSNRVDVSGALVRRMDANRQLALQAGLTEVRYSESGLAEPDYRRHDLIALYSSLQERLELELAAGYTQVDPDGRSSLSSPLARLRAIWNLDDTHSVQALGVYELTDSVRHLAYEIDQIEVPFVGGGRLPVGADLYRLASIEVGWHQRLARLRWSITPFHYDYDFQGDPRSDYTETGVDLSATYSITRLMSLRAGMRAERRSFDEDERRDTDTQAWLSLNRRFSPRWSGRIGVVRHQRDSNVPGADNRENIAMLYVTFHAGR